MSNTNNPQLEKLKAEYQELILDKELPYYLRQEVALLFFLLDKEKNTFFWDKDGNYLQLIAKGSAVTEMYALAEILGMEIQTADVDTEEKFTVYSTRTTYYPYNNVCDLLTEMINIAFPEAPIQHLKHLASYD